MNVLRFHDKMFQFFFHFHLEHSMNVSLSMGNIGTTKLKTVIQFNRSVNSVLRKFLFKGSCLVLNCWKTCPISINKTEKWFREMHQVAEKHQQVERNESTPASGWNVYKTRVDIGLNSSSSDRARL